MALLVALVEEDDDDWGGNTKNEEMFVLKLKSQFSVKIEKGALDQIAPMKFGGVQWMMKL
jgi:hypothetical protein